MATTNPRAARERKQKMFVVVGGVLLLALLAFQLPKLLGGSEPSAAGTTTTDTTTVAGETTPPPDTAVPTSVGLVDTDRRLAPGPGQLRSFGTFTRKDPFVQQLVPPATGEGAAAGSGGGTVEDKPGEGKPSEGKTPANPRSKGFTVGGAAAASVTVISVNGARQTLAPGTAFPAADPVFVLVSEQPGAKSVVVSVAGGAYANGERATKLKLGQPLVLVNTTTGARYRLVLVAVGNGIATSAQGTAPGEERATTP
jgi:hypothetical protein